MHFQRPTIKLSCEYGDCRNEINIFQELFQDSPDIDYINLDTSIKNIISTASMMIRHRSDFLKKITPWVSPSDNLIGKVFLNPPFTDKVCKSLIHKDILEMGEIYEREWNAMADAIIQKAVNGVKNYMQHDCCQRLQYALYQEKCFHMAKRIYEKNRTTDINHAKLKKMKKTFEVANRQFTKFLAEKFDLEAQILIREAIEESKREAEQNSVELLEKLLVEQGDRFEKIWENSISWQRDMDIRLLQKVWNESNNMFRNQTHAFLSREVPQLLHIICAERESANKHIMEIIQQHEKVLHELKLKVKEILDWTPEVKECPNIAIWREKCCFLLKKVQEFSEHTVSQSKGSLNYMEALESLIRQKYSDLKVAPQEEKKKCDKKPNNDKNDTCNCAICGSVAFISIGCAECKCRTPFKITSNDSLHPCEKPQEDDRMTCDSHDDDSHIKPKKHCPPDEYFYKEWSELKKAESMEFDMLSVKTHLSEMVSRLWDDESADTINRPSRITDLSQTTAKRIIAALDPAAISNKIIALFYTGEVNIPEESLLSARNDILFTLSKEIPKVLPVNKLAKWLNKAINNKILLAKDHFERTETQMSLTARDSFKTIDLPRKMFDNEVKVYYDKPEKPVERKSVINKSRNMSYLLYKHIKLPSEDSYESLDKLKQQTKSKLTVLHSKVNHYDVNETYMTPDDHCFQSFLDKLRQSPVVPQLDPEDFKELQNQLEKSKVRIQTEFSFYFRASDYWYNTILEQTKTINPTKSLVLKKIMDKDKPPSFSMKRHLQTVTKTVDLGPLMNYLMSSNNTQNEREVIMNKLMDEFNKIVNPDSEKEDDDVETNTKNI